MSHTTHMSHRRKHRHIPSPVSVFFMVVLGFMSVFMFAVGRWDYTCALVGGWVLGVGVKW